MSMRRLLRALAPLVVFAAGAAGASSPAWRAPTLAVAGAEQPVRLQSLRIDAELAGGVAETRVEMTFFNPNARVLEGALRFPLAHAQVVTGFALDVDGRLRDAVPVRKARAEQVFEDITRQRIDPGLLQHLQGNAYEIRVYPLEPGRTRTVSLTLREPAGARWTLPLAYAPAVPRLEVALRLPTATAPPTLEGGAALGLAFVAERRGGFSATSIRDDVALPATPLVLQARDDRGGVETTTEARDGESWFAASLPLRDRHTLPRPLPRRVQIVWDASASGARRDHARELGLLDAYLRRAVAIDVTLTRVADAVQPAERFAVRGGDWSALRAALQATVYDGASRLSAVRHDGTSDEAIWFTDGLANYGATWQPRFPVPAYAVSSSREADAKALAMLGESSGGRFIDLAALGADGGRRALLERGAEVIDVKAVGARDVVLQSRTPAEGRLALAGAFTSKRATVTLQVRAADGAVSTHRLDVDAGANAGRFAGAEWARLTLAALADDTPASRERVAAIGQRFAIATRETSLIVLERIDDYVRHGIEPPVAEKALRDAYARLAIEKRADGERERAARIARVVQRFEQRVAWWQRDFPKDAPSKAALQVAAPRELGGVGALRRDAPAAPAPDALAAAPELLRQLREQSAAAPAQASRATARTLAAGTADGRGEAAARRRDRDDDAAGSSEVAIALRPASTDAAWLRRLERAAPAARTAVYLDERRRQPSSVGFFLDAADWFLARGDAESRATGLRALSNLAELDLQNRQLLRLLGYRLVQAGEHALAVPVFERVRAIAPYEPQSHRDLGLALAESGETQRAVESLYEVVAGRWDARFSDVELIALGELNAVVAQAARDGRPLDTAAFDARLLRNLPLDLRVVLAWDADATDVDLHVVDPNGDEVSFARPLSYQGGTITRDATGGYGPEEFLLKVAKPGRYRVEARFHGHRQQVLTTSTGLMLRLSSGFATANQHDQRTTLRLQSRSGERVLVGEFEVKPGRS